MNRTWKFVSAASALATTLLLWGCDGLSEVTQPLSPTAAAAAKGGTKAQLKLVQLSNWGQDGAEYYDVLGREGGRVGTDAYRLDVGRNAVSERTLFVIGAAPGDNDEVIVKATATSCPEPSTAQQCYADIDAGRRRANDVGEAGFKTPVAISIGFNPGGGVGNSTWRKLQMVWVRPGNVLEAVPTNVYMAQKEVRGLVDHFSLYGIAWP